MDGNNKKRSNCGRTTQFKPIHITYESGRGASGHTMCLPYTIRNRIFYGLSRKGMRLPRGHQEGAKWAKCRKAGRHRPSPHHRTPNATIFSESPKSNASGLPESAIGPWPISTFAAPAVLRQDKPPQQPDMATEGWHQRELHLLLARSQTRLIEFLEEAQITRLDGHLESIDYKVR